jgi:hypothetical protein
MTADTAPSDSSPPPFGNAYAKARKAYGLSSAILLAWELVGIEVDPRPIETLKIALKSPQAVPYVLIALVVYFAFHFTVEWYQSAESRRKLRVSRVDFLAAHLIGTGALALYGVQVLLRIQVADVLPAREIFLFITGVGFAAGLTNTIRDLRRAEWQARKFLSIQDDLHSPWAVVMSLAMFIAVIIFYPNKPVPLMRMFLFAGLGCISSFAVEIIARLQAHVRRRAQRA